MDVSYGRDIFYEESSVAQDYQKKEKRSVGRPTLPRFAAERRRQLFYDDKSDEERAYDSTDMRRYRKAEKKRKGDREPDGRRAAADAAEQHALKRFQAAENAL